MKLINECCELVADGLDVLGQYSSEKAKRYCPAGMYPGLNASGNYTTNVYTKGKRGVTGRVSNARSDNSIRLDGFFRTKGRGACSSEEKIPDPKDIYILVSSFIRLVVPGICDRLCRKIEANNEQKELLNKLNTFTTANVKNSMTNPLSPTNTESQKYIIHFPDTQTELQDDTSRRCGSR